MPSTKVCHDHFAQVTVSKVGSDLVKPDEICEKILTAILGWIWSFGSVDTARDSLANILSNHQV